MGLCARSVVNALISIEKLLNSPPVALALHVERLNLPLFVEVGHPLGAVVVHQHVTEVIQSKRLNLSMVTIREINHFGSAKMLIGSELSSSQEFEPIAHEMSIEFHQEAH